jgi:hypothetical protein
MALNKLTKAILIFGELADTVKVKELLREKNIEITEYPAQYQKAFSLIAVPGYEVIKERDNIIRYINSFNSKKKSA